MYLKTMKKLIGLSRAFVDSADQPILSSYTFEKYEVIGLKSRSRKIIENLKGFICKSEN